MTAYRDENFAGLHKSPDNEISLEYLILFWLESSIKPQLIKRKESINLTKVPKEQTRVHLVEEHKTFHCHQGDDDEDEYFEDVDGVCLMLGDGNEEGKCNRKNV